MRRTITIAVSGALLVALVAVAALLPVPYVALSPGPTENTLGAYDGIEVIVIEGEQTYPTEGNLDLTTVSVTRADSELQLLDALKLWADPEVAVVPREQIYPPNVGAEVVRERNAEQMVTSQQNAIVAALRELDIDVLDRVVVHSIVEGAPALGRLEAGDVILAVDGEEVSEVAQVGDLITGHEPGEDVTFTVKRDGEQLDVTVATEEATEGEPRAVVGILPAMGFDFPFEVEITLGEEIGGPSAGLLFALGIVDKLTPGALTDGAHVAGTGTIDADGTVGAIGGIQQKVAGARNVGATVFLVPADDCAGAVAAGIDDIQLVRVETLDDARSSLDAIADGSPDFPRCTS